MKKKIESMLKKYEKFVENIKWHIRTNKPWGSDLEKLEKEIRVYEEIVEDIKGIIY